MMVLSVMPQEETSMNKYVLLKNHQQRKLPWRVCPPEQGSGHIWKVFLGRLPREKVEQGKVPMQQQHAYVLQGMQRISRKRHFPLKQLHQGCTSELPPALPHLPSQQGICINEGNKLNTSIHITNQIL
jgi:hypothetical protein